MSIAHFSRIEASIEEWRWHRRKKDRFYFYNRIFHRPPLHPPHLRDLLSRDEDRATGTGERMKDAVFTTKISIGDEEGARSFSFDLCRRWREM